MDKLFCFGLGYTAAADLRLFGSRFSSVAGTVREAAPRGHPAPDRSGLNVTTFIFGDVAAEQALAQTLSEATCTLVSIQPQAGRDPVLATYGEALRRAHSMRTIVYLSTVGVYGDHGGAWIDEDTPVNPTSARSRTRVLVEQEWRDFSRQSGKAVAILRLAGIYGPGRNALADLREGTARRIGKPGQVFNRIHVDDIARTIDAAFRHRADGLFNVADDAPGPASEVVAYAAGLLGVLPPPEIPYDVAQATMTEMARSFYGESKRARNTRIKDVLGVTLAYPTYREGLRQIQKTGI
ncbi:MAG: NAD(P)-dependent oxidoreductase [Alphaproteobacteria bacterium]|nr:NAD(P)-dependent oxidoreductase [Alphaproteobacteria bacterium]